MNILLEEKRESFFTKHKPENRLNPALYLSLGFDASKRDFFIFNI